MIAELGELGDTVRIGLDVVGGIASLAEVILAEAGFALVHVSSLAVNRARQGPAAVRTSPIRAMLAPWPTKSAPRTDLRPIEAASELDLEIRSLVGRRRDLVDGETQCLARLHNLLVGIFPGLERALDLTTKGPLHLLTRFITPAELRAAGKKRLVRHLQAAGGLPKDGSDAAGRGARVGGAEAGEIACLGNQFSGEHDPQSGQAADEGRVRVVFEQRLQLAIRLAQAGAVGQGLAGEFADQARGHALGRDGDGLLVRGGKCALGERLDLRQSAKTHFLRRPTGNKGLKRVSYQSAFCSLGHNDSRAFYNRKRHEGNRHHRAVIALARRRINVLWAVFQSLTPFQAGFKTGP